MLFFAFIVLGISFLIQANENISLGDGNSHKTWIYLSGLLKDFNSADEKNNRLLLDRIGKEFNIKFITVKPTARNNHGQLYWPHDNDAEMQLTYHQIMKSIVQNPICGYIGFSNGGFFLNRLAQFVPLNKPIISIGAAGKFFNTPTQNSIYLVIGRNDVHHYEYAKAFYQHSLHSPLKVELIETNDEHIVPEIALKRIFQIIPPC